MSRFVDTQFQARRAARGAAARGSHGTRAHGTEIGVESERVCGHLSTPSATPTYAATELRGTYSYTKLRGKYCLLSKVL